MIEKEYHLKNWRTKIAGSVLLLVGFMQFFIFFESSFTLLENLESMFLSFRSVSRFLVTLFMLAIKASFIVLGLYLFKNKNTITRAKVDNKGIYFKEMSGSGLSRGTFDFNPFTFLSYKKIKNIHLIKNFWLGYTLEVETETTRIKLITTNALSYIDKKDIYEAVKKQIRQN